MQMSVREHILPKKEYAGFTAQTEDGEKEV